MDSRPSKLELRAGGVLAIGWDDDTTRLYSPRELREACPCATCRENRSAAAPPPLLPVLSAAETQPLAIAAMTPVGNYAYSFTFSDGHDTGIYTLELLRTLGRAE